MDDALDIMMNIDDDCLADDFFKEGCLDLAMLPPSENNVTLSDQDSDALNDMNKKVVHYLTRHLLNPT